MTFRKFSITRHGLGEKLKRDWRSFGYPEVRADGPEVRQSFINGEVLRSNGGEVWVEISDQRRQSGLTNTFLASDGPKIRWTLVVVLFVLFLGQLFNFRTGLE